jgi:hypothetical protein
MNNERRGKKTKQKERQKVIEKEKRRRRKGCPATQHHTLPSHLNCKYASCRRTKSKQGV